MFERHWQVACHWDGRALAPADRTFVRARIDTTLVVEVDAPWRGDAAPVAPVGSLWGLWNHEVVELFLARGAAEYFELELGPHGHFLALRLSGPRRIVQRVLDVNYRVQRRGARWRGVARIALHHVPLGVSRGAAFAVWGPADARCYGVDRPLGTVRPDFHAVHRFGPLVQRQRGFSG